MRKSNVRLQSLQFSAPLEGRIFWLRSLFRSNRRPHGLDNLKVTASRLDCIIQSRSHRRLVPPQNRGVFGSSSYVNSMMLWGNISKR
jgi:hypothetical protein